MHRPILTRAPRNQTALIGSNASMVCEVLSDAHRHLEWYHGYHTFFDTVNKTNQSLRVEVKVGAQHLCCFFSFLLLHLLLLLLFLLFPLSLTHFRLLSLDYSNSSLLHSLTRWLHTLLLFGWRNSGMRLRIHVCTCMCVFFPQMA